MGGEFAQKEEWNSGTSLSWDRSKEPMPAGVASMLGDLNQLQQHHAAFSEWDHDARGFEWLSGEDKEQSVISFLRRSEYETVVVVLNFTPLAREGYRVPVPMSGTYSELFNSDTVAYGGSGVHIQGELYTEAVPYHGREHSLCFTLPPLGGVVLRYQS